MSLRIVLTSLLIATALPAAAQVIGEPIPGQTRTKSPGEPWKPAKASRPCPEYGPGFVRVEGGSACVRVGGSVAAEYGVGSGGRSGSAVTGVGRLEIRDQTSFGQMRTVIQGGGRIDRGRDGYAYGYYR